MKVTLDKYFLIINFLLVAFWAAYTGRFTLINVIGWGFGFLLYFIFVDVIAKQIREKILTKKQLKNTHYEKYINCYLEASSTRFLTAR